jgi:hypothetical protein
MKDGYVKNVIILIMKQEKSVINVILIKKWKNCTKIIIMILKKIKN